MQDHKEISHSITESSSSSSSQKKSVSENEKPPEVEGHYRDRFLSWLDRLDKKISEPLFKLLLPLWLEFVLSIPGNFFGTPAFSTIVAPSLIAWMDNSSSRSSAVVAGERTSTPQLWWCWYICVACAFLVVVSIWTAILRGKRMLPLFFGSAVGILGPPLGVALVSACPQHQSPPPNLGYFQLAAWCAVVIPIALLKPLFKRTRPIVVYRFPKRLTVISKFLRHDSLRSFPSGDVAASVAFAYPLWRCSVVPKPVAASLVALSAFGRMYWQAHHFGDVVAGFLVAVPACMVLERMVSKNAADGGDSACPCHNAQWWHPLVAHVTLAVVVISTRSILKEKVFLTGTIQTQHRQKTK